MPATSPRDTWTMRGYSGTLPVTVRVQARSEPWSASDHGGLWRPGNAEAGVLRVTWGGWSAQWVMPSVAMAMRHGWSVLVDPAILQGLAGWTVGKGLGMQKALDTERVWFKDEADLAALLVAEVGKPRHPLNAGDIARTAAHVATWVGTKAITVEGLDVTDVARLVEAVRTMANKPTIIGEVAPNGTRYARVLTSGVGAGAEYRIADGVRWLDIAQEIMDGRDLAGRAVPVKRHIPATTREVFVARMRDDGQLQWHAAGDNVNG